MKELIIMCGLPRSGKSTKCREEWQPMGYVVVNPDKMRIAYHGKAFYPEKEREVWTMAEVFVKMLMLQGNNIVLDATNISVKGRAKWIDIAKQNKYKAFIHWVQTDKEECLRRNHGEGAVPPEVIERMSTKFEAPTQAEGHIIYDLKED